MDKQPNVTRRKPSRFRPLHSFSLALPAGVGNTSHCACCGCVCPVCRLDHRAGPPIQSRGYLCARETLSPEPDPAAFSRRGFLETAAIVAAAGGLPRLLERKAAAADTTANSHADATSHPLDPLSAAELLLSVDVLKKSQKVGETFRFVSCVLAEPAKAIVQDDKLLRTCPRQASVVLLDNATGTGYEAVVDLRKQAVVRFEVAAPRHPAIDHVGRVRRVRGGVRRCPQFLAALPSAASRTPAWSWSIPGRRAIYGTEVARRQGAAAVARPVLGPLRGERERLRPAARRRRCRGRSQSHGSLRDRRLWRRPAAAAKAAIGRGSYCPRWHGPQAAVRSSSPRARAFRRRLRGSLAKVEVPHRLHAARGAGAAHSQLLRRRPGTSGPAPRQPRARWSCPTATRANSHFRKNAFDIGEYGIGMLANSLALGCDCLGTIHYFDAHMNNSRGEPVTIKNAVCLHEEDIGLLWKHTDWRTNQVETRRVAPAVRVVRRHRRQLRVRLLLVSVPGRHDPVRSEVDRHHEHHGAGSGGSLGVRRRWPRDLNAPFHQHIFAARLDMSVDGDDQLGI